MELIKLRTRIRTEGNFFTNDVYLDVYYDENKLDSFIRKNHEDNKVKYLGLDEWLLCVSYSQAWYIYTNVNHEKSEFISFK